MKLVGGQQAALASLIGLAKHELATWQELIGFITARAALEGHHAHQLQASWNAKGGGDTIDAIAGFFAGLVDDVLEVSDAKGGAAATDAGQDARTVPSSLGHFGTLRDALSSMDVGIAGQVAASQATASALVAVASEAKVGLAEHESRLHETFGRAVDELRQLSEALQVLEASRAAFRRWGSRRGELEEQMVASVRLDQPRGDAELEALSQRLAESAEAASAAEAEYRAMLERANAQLETFHAAAMPELMQTYRSLRAERMDSLRTMLCGYAAALGTAASADGSSCAFLQAAAAHIDADLDYGNLLETAAPLMARDKMLEFEPLSQKHRVKVEGHRAAASVSVRAGSQHSDSAVQAEDEARIVAGETTAEEINSASKAAAARRSRRKRQMEQSEATEQHIIAAPEEQSELEQRRRSLFGQRGDAVGGSGSGSSDDDEESSASGGSDSGNSDTRVGKSSAKHVRSVIPMGRLGAGIGRPKVTVDVFVCVRRSVYRASAERDSKQVGVIEIGEHVEVLEQCFVPYHSSAGGGGGSNAKQQLRVRGVRGWASVESTKGLVILTPADSTALLWYQDLALLSQQRCSANAGKDVDKQRTLVDKTPGVNDGQQHHGEPRQQQSQTMSDTGVFSRLCAAAIRIDATTVGNHSSSSGNNRGPATPWLLAMDVGAYPKLRAKANSLLQLLAKCGVSGTDSMSAAKVAQEYGTAVYSALGLWMRARRWPLIPIRFYARATGADPDLLTESVDVDDQDRVKQLLRQLPRHSTEAVESVAREAVQLLYVAPRIAGHTTHELATLLAPAFLWVRIHHDTVYQAGPYDCQHSWSVPRSFAHSCFLTTLRRGHVATLCACMPA